MAKPRRFTIAGLAVLAIPALTGIHMALGQMTGNFHEVLPGQLYRSAQPDGDDIDEMVRVHGVRTIINLRDEARESWYAEAGSAAARNGVEMVDFPISSAHEVPVETLQQLAVIMRDAEKPLLIHCEHGANRTGLASAVYVGAVAGRSELLAEFQLSPFYGHVPIPGIGRYEMYSSWDRFEETIGF
ncbi:tyrosine protein phosphatase [Aureimonas altamirensis]|uniref:Tyrosine protein phosphatase n=1 Tax=Aureimonas altamirensis TaxID=370622 RepID=A0A0B1Q4J2_9HYPH|nr:dual specificity protein phosphatase family protein [Aureimonas altamirensis]KHJ54301.1 tyrosine protein phosphatase [Aureimonas altamirensis]